MNLQTTLETLLTEEFYRKDINDENIYFIPKSAFSLGTCNTEEFSNKSDIDVQLVYKDIDIDNPKIKKTLEILTNRLQQETGREVNIWANPESTYNNDNQFENTPTNDYFELDGWDNICGKYLKKLIKDTGKTVFGKNYLKNIILSDFTKQDAHELFLVSAVDFGKNNVYKKAKGILRAFAANHMVKTGEALTQYIDMTEAAKGTKYESLIWEAYITKIHSHRSLIDKIKFLWNNKEWPKPKFNQKEAIHLMLETKNLTMPKVQSLQEETYQTRTSLRLVEKLFEFRDILEPELYNIFTQELMNYLHLTDKEQDLYIPYQERKLKIAQKIFDSMDFDSMNSLQTKFPEFEDLVFKNDMICLEHIKLSDDQYEQIEKICEEDENLKPYLIKFLRSEAIINNKKYTEKLINIIQNELKKEPNNLQYLKIMAEFSEDKKTYLKQIIELQPDNVKAIYKFSKELDHLESEILVLSKRKIIPTHPFLDLADIERINNKMQNSDKIDIQDFDEGNKKILSFLDQIKDYADCTTFGGENIPLLKEQCAEFGIILMYHQISSTSGFTKITPTLEEIEIILSEIKESYSERKALGMYIKAYKLGHLGELYQSESILNLINLQIEQGIVPEQMRPMLYRPICEFEIKLGHFENALKKIDIYEKELMKHESNLHPTLKLNRTGDIAYFKAYAYDGLNDERAKIYAQQVIDHDNKKGYETIKLIKKIFDSY